MLSKIKVLFLAKNIQFNFEEIRFFVLKSQCYNDIVNRIPKGLDTLFLIVSRTIAYWDAGRVRLFI